MIHSLLSISDKMYVDTVVLLMLYPIVLNTPNIQVNHLMCVHPFYFCCAFFDIFFIIYLFICLLFIYKLNYMSYLFSSFFCSYFVLYQLNTSNFFVFQYLFFRAVFLRTKLTYKSLLKQKM